jgi:hypothetical protein
MGNVGVSTGESVVALYGVCGAGGNMLEVKVGFTTVSKDRPFPVQEGRRKSMKIII